MSKNKTIQLEEVLKRLEKKFKDPKLRGLVFKYAKRFIFALLAVAFTGGISYAGYTFYASNDLEDNYDKITDGLVLDINLSENNYDSSTKAFTDNSDIGNDGVSTNMASFVTDNYGNSNGAMSFNGTTDYVNINSSDSLRYFGDSITMSAWIKPSILLGTQVILNRYNTYNALYLDDDKVYCKVFTDVAGRDVTGEISVVGDKWTQVSCVYDGGNLRLYVNGVVDPNVSSSITGDVSTSSHVWMIGNYYWSGVDHSQFTGDISSVKIWNKALTADEMYKLYNSSKSGLVIDIDLSEDNYEPSSKTFYDKSGLGSHGVSTNAASFVPDKIGKSVGAMSFNGTTDFVDLEGTATGGVNPLELDDSFTIATWINFRESKSSYLINNYQGTSPYSGNSVTLHADPSGEGVTIEAHVDDGSSPTSPVGSVLNLNQWYHVVLIRDKGNTIKIFVDAEEDVSIPDITTGDVLSDRNWTIGAKSQNTTEENFNGTMSSVKIYSKALSANEITNLYNDSKPKVNISSRSKGLVGYWPLDSESEKVGDDINSNFDFTTWTNTGFDLVTSNSITSNGDDWGYIRGRLSFVSGGTWIIKISGISTVDWVLRDYDISGYNKSYSSGAFDEVFTTTMLSGDEPMGISVNNGNSGIITFTEFSIKQLRSADKTPYSNHGDIYGATYTTDRKSNADKALAFDGVDDYIEIANESNFDFGLESFSSSFWFKGQTTNWKRILSKGKDTIPGWGCYDAGNNDYQMRWALRDSSSFIAVTQPEVVFDNTWHHAVWLVNRNTNLVSWYFDGVKSPIETDISSIGDISNDLPLTFGSIPGGTNNHFTGSISDVRVYNRTISEEEIKSLYGSYRPKISAGSLQKGLVLDMPLTSKREKVESVYSDNFTNDISGWSGEEATASHYTVDTDSVGRTKILKNEVNSVTNSRVRVTPGVTYGTNLRLTFDYYIPSSNITVDGLRPSIYVGGAQQYLTNQNTTDTWTTATLDFLIDGVAIGDLWFYMTDNGIRTNSTIGDKVYIDNVSIKELKTADRTPYSNHGTIYGATVGADYTSFDGVDDYVDLGSGSNLQMDTGAVTVSAWVEVSEVWASSYREIFYGGATGGNTGYGIMLSRDNVNGIYYEVYGSSGGRQVKNPLDVISSGWNHVVAIFNGIDNYMKLYVDGIEKHSASISDPGTVTNNNNFYIGRHGSGSYFYDSMINDVKIYNRALSTEEVDLLYSKGR